MNSPYLTILVILVVCGLSLCDPTTQLLQGSLQGSWMTTRGGRSVAAFKGIPYAQPPVKALRFRSPVQAEPWSEVKLAEDNAPQCIQYLDILDSVVGEEDCLYLNVYSPNLNGSLPVLFYIHGGSYKTGSADSSLLGPEFLLDQNVILVTIQYRLGIFGFLTLEDAALPGNLGLKDQRAALRWVRDNIAQFGGDPARVTIFGQSAGAMSAHFHLLFNNREGLFRAGILHSGTAYSAGVFQRPGEQRPLVEHLLNQTGCAADDKSAVVECLRSVSASSLISIVNSFSWFLYNESTKSGKDLVYKNFVS